MKNNISKLRNCYGCGVCVAACPKKIIELRKNESGFYAPAVIDQERCIDCGICLDVCAFNHTDLSLEQPYPSTFAGWSKDQSVRQRCSSGGIGFEIGRACIDRGWKVCAVRYNAAARKAEHFIASTPEELMPSVGSKYIPSFTSDAFQCIDRKQKYLVTGTPCQIDSFRRYIRRFKIEDNFLLLDFFCHGVPSLLLWDSYLKEVEEITGPSTFVSWRNKTTGQHDYRGVCLDVDDKSLDWHESYNLLIRGEKHFYQSRWSAGDLFYKFFLGNYCLNTCCYKNCKYKCMKSSADIRIGDLWGRKYASDQLGTSAVIASTAKGKEFLKELIADRITLTQETPEVITDGQMSASPRLPWVRDIILKSLASGKKLKHIDQRWVSIYKISILPRRVIDKIRRTFFRK